MGGYGSGNWIRHDRKVTVEESLKIDIMNLNVPFEKDCSGSITWFSDYRREAKVGFSVFGSKQSRIFRVSYDWKKQGLIEADYSLQHTPLNYGGRRWWFTCTAKIDGHKCNRRVRTLFLPPGEKFFACRTCHGLAYRSTQDAHLCERMMKKFLS